jgi:hypothetical protein
MLPCNQGKLNGLHYINITQLKFITLIALIGFKQMYILPSDICFHYKRLEARGSVMVEILCYKPEGRRFETQ